MCILEVFPTLEHVKKFKYITECGFQDVHSNLEIHSKMHNS